VPTQVVAKRLHDSDHAGRDAVTSRRSHSDHLPGCLVRHTAQPPEQRPVVKEIGPQHLGNGEDPLRMTHVGEHVLAQECRQRSRTLGRARGAQPTPLAREGAP
jgi:hypothetical protein